MLTNLVYYSFTGKTVNFVNQMVHAEYNSVGTSRVFDLSVSETGKED